MSHNDKGFLRQRSHVSIDLGVSEVDSIDFDEYSRPLLRPDDFIPIIRFWRSTLKWSS